MAGVGAPPHASLPREMSSRPLTIADLRRAGTVSSFEIVAAIDRYMRDPTTGPYRFASGHGVDIAAAVAASSDIAELRTNPGPQGKTLRHAVTVITMAAQVVPPTAGR